MCFHCTWLVECNAVRRCWRAANTISRHVSAPQAALFRTTISLTKLCRAGNAILFALMTFTCLSGSIVINHIGLRHTLALGTTGYALYSAALYQVGEILVSRLHFRSDFNPRTIATGQYGSFISVLRHVASLPVSSGRPKVR